MAFGTKAPTTGFQGTITKRLEAYIYPAVDDPVEQRDRQTIAITAAAGAVDQPVVVGCSTQKSITGPGSFSIDIQEPAGFGLIDKLVDDDWIDIVANINGRRYHVLRGQVLDFRGATTVASGATSNLVTITGQDFQRVLQTVEAWYNQWRGENVGTEETIKIFDVPGIFYGPAETVKLIIFGFLNSLTRLKRANWRLPESMPGIIALSAAEPATIASTLKFVQRGFNNEPARRAIDMQLMSPSGQSVWALAQEWSDPAFCELFADLIDGSSEALLDPKEEWTPDKTTMGVVFRDRPFVSTKLELQSPWFLLPTATVQRQELTGESVGKGGAERFNAYFVSPNMQNLGPIGTDLLGPLWNVREVEQHGLRRFDLESHYAAEVNDQLLCSMEMRKRALEYHALNPYLWNGTLFVGRNRPDIRVGMRVRIPGADENETETYYVETVGHDFGVPGSTTLGVTRGWKGTDATLLSALRAAVAGYEARTRTADTSVDDIP
jgi:hypothetical protein